MLVCWFTGTNDSSTKRLMSQAFFFIIHFRLMALKTLYFCYCKSIKKNEKRKLKRFLQTILQEIMKKPNNWSMKRLVSESFVPANQRNSILLCRLSDFLCHHFKGLMADLYVASPKSSLIDYRKVVSNHFVVLLRANTVSFPTSPQLWP